MRCPNCRTEVPDGFASCAVCGTEVGAPSPVPAAARGDRPSSKRGSPLVADGDTGGRLMPRTGPIPRWDREGGPPHLPQTGPLPAVPRPAAGEVATPRGAMPPTGPQPQLSRAGQREVFGPADGEPIATRLLEEDPQIARETRIVDVSVPALVKRSGRQRGAEGPKAAAAGEREASLAGPLEEVVEGARQAYARLHRLDRLTVWLLLGSFVAAFLPWRHVRGVGLVSGIETAGAASAGCAAAALLWIYRRTVRRRRAALYVLLQLLFAAGTGAGALYGLIAGEGRVAFGLFAALGGAAFAVLLTLLRLLRLGGA